MIFVVDVVSVKMPAPLTPSHPKSSSLEVSINGMSTSTGASLISQRPLGALSASRCALVTAYGGSESGGKAEKAGTAIGI